MSELRARLHEKEEALSDKVKQADYKSLQLVVLQRQKQVLLQQQMLELPTVQVNQMWASEQEEKEQDEEEKVEERTLLSSSSALCWVEWVSQQELTKEQHSNAALEPVTNGNQLQRTATYCNTLQRMATPQSEAAAEAVTDAAAVDRVTEGVLRLSPAQRDRCRACFHPSLMRLPPHQSIYVLLSYSLFTLNCVCQCVCKREGV